MITVFEHTKSGNLIVDVDGIYYFKIKPSAFENGEFTDYLGIHKQSIVNDDRTSYINRNISGLPLYATLEIVKIISNGFKHLED